MSGDATTSPPPPVLWAQRSKTILLTICLEDCKKPDIQILNDKIHFKGIGGTDQKEHEVTINLYKEIDPAESLYSVRDRIIEFVLQKKEDGPYWPQLTKEKVKYHWLRVDFNKWQEEDESDLEAMSNPPLDVNLEHVMKSFGKDSDGGDEKFNLDNNSESDSDDGELPDLV